MRRIRKSSTSASNGKIDKTFFLLTIGLTVLGLLSVANTSAPLAAAVFGDPFFFVKQQFVWAALGIAVLIVAASLPISIIKKFSGYFFYLVVFFLVLVLIPGFGSKLLGARRWLYLGPIGFQPSELIKVALVLFFAKMADEDQPLKKFVWTLLLVCGLVMLQPDLGTTIVIVSIAFTQLFIMEVPLFSLGVLGIGGLLSGAVLSLISPYRRARLMTFFSPHDDPSGVDYHVRQILLALGSGGIFGRGLGQSRQKQLFLPETATDSVFAIIAEELGFIGSVTILLLLLFFIFRGLTIVRKADNKFVKIMAVGIVAWLASQTFFNLASMVVLTPLTGIPLPFFSYGGSNLTMILLSAGLLLNCSKNGK